MMLSLLHRREKILFPIDVCLLKTSVHKIFIGPLQNIGAVILFAFKVLLKQNDLHLYIRCVPKTDPRHC